MIITKNYLSSDTQFFSHMTSEISINHKSLFNNFARFVNYLLLEHDFIPAKRKNITL